MGIYHVEHHQERSRRSAEQILDAAMDVIRVEGFEEFTMQSVATRANGSVGRVYARYANKESLLLAVKDRAYTKLEGDVASALAQNADLPSRVDAFVTTVSDTFFSAVKLFSFVVVHSADDTKMRERGLVFHENLRAQFVSRLEEIGVQNRHKTMNVYEMIIQSLLMRVITVGNLQPGNAPYANIPSTAEYKAFLIDTAVNVLSH